MLIPSLLLFWPWQLGKSMLIVFGISCRNGSHLDNMGTSLYYSQNGVIDRDKIHWIFYSIKFLAPSTLSSGP